MNNLKTTRPSTLKSTVNQVSKAFYTLINGVLVNLQDAREYDAR